MTLASNMVSTSNIFTASFVEQVLALLKPEHCKILRTIKLPPASDDSARLGCFLDLLFARALSEFIRNKTPSDIARVVHGCCDVIAAWSKNPASIGSLILQSETSCSMFLALSDHPFIISTIAERLHEAEIQLECFQHPILTIDTTSVALSYLEIHPRCADDIAVAQPKVLEALDALKQVVADHQEMISLVRAIKRSTGTPWSTEYGEISGHEGSAFLDWLTSGTFFFVAASTWMGSNTSIQKLGIWKIPGSYRDALETEVKEDIASAEIPQPEISIHKLRLSSLVHRRASLLHIMIKHQDGSGHASSIVGYLTSKAWTSEAADIPLLREKLLHVLALEKTPPNSHDYKYVNEVIDNMPTDEAFALPVADMRSIAQLALGVFSQEDSRSATFIDPRHRRALTLIVVPPSRYSAEIGADLQQRIETHLGAPPHSSEIHLDSSKKRQLRLYISTPLPRSLNRAVNLESLGKTLQEATISWFDSFMQRVEIETRQPFEAAVEFPENYQVATSVAEAVEDFRLATALTPQRTLGVSMFSGGDPEETKTLTFLSRGAGISISRAVPILENIQIEVLDANSYTMTLEGQEIHALKCQIRAYDRELFEPRRFNQAVSPGLEQILAGTALDDPLNVLLRRIPVTIEQISLLRGYCAFLWQVQKIATKRTMWKSLAFAPEVARHILNLFDVTFNPKLQLSPDHRLTRRASLEGEIQQALRSVSDITHDRILRALVGLVRNSIRSNFYANPRALAIKIASQKVEFMPHPRPLFEIFVFSPRIEGTHLRSAKVSRGGIRWSERIDDYRSEVLGLMKTQRVKNVIIVPSGAKGGFIVKNLPSSPEAIPAAVETGYREYITALLSIADNKVGETVVSPRDCVVLDEPDPYFVVAADKGTATFSDVANSIAQKDFNYWLGDAFASGGSAGYDHKKFGITAKGGWECVIRHCRDLGIDMSKPFSAVGIGDLSGDVFGNAMILSEQLSLIAAFNHKHIFIDPTPDNHKAFAERSRLFKLPRSQWSDYDPTLISHGGGVFGRFNKEITLTPEIRRVLGVADDSPSTVDGETLISLILKAPVDLLWNGGIGTYVKARTESHADVNDGANDNVRISADELRARIVGEGGNLGFTQKARVEFSIRGGRINTDAIDNSGGVDLSDHEVNLKLLFSPLVASRSITLEIRNSELQSIAGDVVDSVLRHNRDQSLMLSIAALRSPALVDQYRNLIREMHRLGFLDRNRDNLPDEQDLDLRLANRAGLTRPELAICSAAVKMWLKEGLRSSALCDDSNLERFVLGYFPARIQDRYRPQVLSHPLRREIIANEIVGDLMPVIGIPFLFNLVSSTNATVPIAMKCLLAADSILGANTLRDHLRRADTAGNWSNFSSLWLDLGVALRRATAWLVQTHGASLSLEDMVRLYREKFSILADHAELVFSGTELSRFRDRISSYQGRGVSIEEATALSLYRRIILVLEVLWSAREFGQDVKEVAQAVSATLDALKVNTLFRFESSLESSNKWEQELIAGAYQEIRRSISCAAGRLLKKGLTSAQQIHAALAAIPLRDSIYATMVEVEDGVKLKRPFQISVLPVVARQLRLLSEAL